MTGRRRTYKSGSRWAFWRWTDVVLEGELYLRRLHLFQCPWFAVMLHWILRPDANRDLHDHPVSFLSVVLRGGYLQEVPHEEGEAFRLERIRWGQYMPAEGAHRILTVLPGTLTLVLAGPRRREWGFLTLDGWVDWRTYQKAGDRR